MWQCGGDGGNDDGSQCIHTVCQADSMRGRNDRAHIHMYKDILYRGLAKPYMYMHLEPVVHMNDPRHTLPNACSIHSFHSNA